MAIGVRAAIHGASESSLAQSGIIGRVGGPRRDRSAGLAIYTDAQSKRLLIANVFCGRWRKLVGGGKILIRSQTNLRAELVLQ
jgi:hypothetical protein